ncbi:hypothetical protein KSD_91880 [Ktedonobacter sp. SOSP1-85]|uniref:vWA domain-containing protein n=1 Tax=Ktedonobacter sp. SOSP1-85 TaxID=2778367 RepID=UPI0019155721|nr:vWA domain-containing protein [Ktedonobacter sp. SOSP1-85]GHO81417.1 hypothetical protein KSD_91880 [Ktedonobacter sp. SOSP1-85]
MKAFFHICYILGALLSALLLTGSITSPASQALAQTIRRGAGLTPIEQNSVTILVLDMSGSMSASDPAGLRCSAANAFIDLSGPSNYIGVVALDGNGATGGPHNFPLAQSWATPGEMATPLQRQALQKTVTEQSHHCQPDSTTPTYDALHRALQMLQQATQDQPRAGSVVLLTDGNPDPGTNDQVNAIQSELLPQFKQHNWSIDTIALGNNAPIQAGTPYHSFHEFLSGLANATSGKFYDDANGVIQGQPSPLNIAPFFVDIFARHNHRTVGDDIGLTQPNGSISRAFNVTSYTDNLDVVVIKDQPGTTVALQDPQGHSVSAQPGVFVSNADPHYVIYSIDRPQQGDWNLTVTGSGRFLMKSLKASSLALSALDISQANLQSGAQSALALGQPITVSTHLTYHGEAITDNTVSLSGHVAYNGTGGQYSQDFALNSKATPGTYTGTIFVPENAPSGSYDITINSYSVSLAHTLSSQLRSLRLEHFPEPNLLSPTTQQPTDQEITVQTVEWDPALRLLYGLPFSPIEWLSQWPLQGIPAQPAPSIEGQTLLRQQAYAHAQVRAEAIPPNAKDPVPVQVQSRQDGRFALTLPNAQSGPYRLLFHTRGSFADSHGDFGTIQRSLRVALVAPTWLQTLRAWLITLLYGLLVLLLVLLVRYTLLPHPFGEVLVSQEGEAVGSVRLQRTRRGLLQALLHPQLLRSRQAGLPPGLRLRFKHGGGIEVARDTSANTSWHKSDGEPVQPAFQELHELHYHPPEEDPGESMATYHIQARHAPDTEEIGKLYEESSRPDTSSSRSSWHQKRRKAARIDNYEDDIF